MANDFTDAWWKRILAQRFCQFAAGDQGGHPSEVGREDPVFDNGSRDRADRRHGRLGAFAGLQRSPEVERLRRRQRLNRQNIPVRW